VKDLIKSLILRTPVRKLWNFFGPGNRVRSRGQNNHVHIGKSFLTQTTIDVIGEGNRVTIGNNCRLHYLQILVTGNNLDIHISDNCILRGKFMVENEGSFIHVGAGTTMEETRLVAVEGASIQVADDCMFAAATSVWAGDMHSMLDALSGKRINPASSVNIHRHVWLCVGVTILKGVEIGDNTVVGAHSLVTTSLPPNVLAVGSPARQIRDHVTWRRERVLELVNSNESPKLV
jgi:acetyltransferase-like isoleucine patch superfamily enzyme